MGSITSTSPQLPTHPKQQKTISFHESLRSRLKQTGNLRTGKQAKHRFLNVRNASKCVFSHILCFLFKTVISGLYIQKFLRENRALHRVNRNQGFQLNFYQKTE